MDEIEYKLESTNPVLIAHAISQLFVSIKKKSTDQQIDHISKVPEFKVLLAKRDSTNVALSISACQALIALVENGLWDIGEALSNFTSSLTSIKNYMVAATATTRLLILDLRCNRETKNTYPFTLHVRQHPFIMILGRDKHTWQTVLNQMTFMVNHRNSKIREQSIQLLRPVFLHILCNPLLDLSDSCMQQVWQLLIKSKHGIRLQTEILLWLRTGSVYSCVNTNYNVLELAQKALLERNAEHCTSLVPMIVSLAIQLIKYGSDPTPNFDTISALIDRCSTSIGNLMLALMAELITLCPAIYLSSALHICMTVTNKMLYNDILLNSLMASILKWMAYPSVLCSDALDMAQDLTKKSFDRAKSTSNSDTEISSKVFSAFTYSDCYIQFYSKMVPRLTTSEPNDVLLWLTNMRSVPFHLKDKCKVLISGLFLQTNEPRVAELSCNILIDISRVIKSFASHVLSLVLHKLTKSRSSAESKYLLLAVPELVNAKENIPIVTHTLDTLLTGDKQLKYFAIELYLKTLKLEPRCYRFVSAAIIRLMKNDHSWYSDVTCARAMKYICENHCEHGEKLVPLLSQILNRSIDTNDGTASALALKSISVLCKASIIDIYSTWRVLAPKLEKEKRTIVLESLCELFGDIPYYPTSQCLEEYDQLIDNVISNLWKYVSCGDARVIESALRAIACYRLEQIPLKALPADFRCNLVLPTAYAKTPGTETQKPEDVLPYIPGTCWIQMLQKINKLVLSTAAHLLIVFVTEEVNSFRSGIYVWPRGEPQDYKYLPQRSVIRAVGEYLRRSDKTDAKNYRCITECLRIFAHRYPKPLPNINWSFLNDTINISPEAKEYTLSIVCHHAAISQSAKSFVENYLLSCTSVSDSDFISRKNECFTLHSNLEDLCQTLQPNTIKPFLESTLAYVVEKMKLHHEDSIDLFGCIMCSYARALKNQQVCDENSTLLSTILVKLFDEIDLTCKRFEPYLKAACELSINHLEKITSPKVWEDVPPGKLKNAIAIVAELAGRNRSKSPLTWLNEIIDETASVSSVHTYLLGTIERVLTEMQFERSISTWILEYMLQIQSILVESSKDHSDRVQFFCDVLFVSVISLSGIHCMFMEQDSVTTSENVRAELFPQALAVLSDRQEWGQEIPQIMDWLNCMRTSNVPNMYKCIFHRSLICLRHHPHYKDVWTKYLSIETDVDI